MDHEQNPISRPPRENAARVRAEQLGWAVEEKVLWRLGDAGRGAFGLIRRAVEGATWALQKHLIWPLRLRLAGLGHGGRVALTGGAALLVAALAAGVLALAGSGGSSEVAPAPVAVAAPPAAAQVAPAAQPKPQKEAPTLRGAAPSFEREAPEQVQKAQAVEAPTGGGAGSGERTTSTSSSAATERISSDPSASASSAAPASGGVEGERENEVIPGRPAGPKAIAVARKFSQAFVVYETGGEESEVQQAFAKTTTPALAKALLRRPPRLPADVKVPRAKVVTVVPGPSREGVYTLSVSLLRVGATSELRLEMEKLKGEGWRVTNVLG